MFVVAIFFTLTSPVCDLFGVTSLALIMAILCSLESFCQSLYDLYLVSGSTFVCESSPCQSLVRLVLRSCDSDSWSQIMALSYLCIVQSIHIVICYLLVLG